MDIEKKYNQSPWAHFPEELVDFGKKLASLRGNNRQKHIRLLARKAHIGPRKLIDLTGQSSCADCDHSKGNHSPECGSSLPRRLLSCHGCRKAFRCLDIHNEFECMKSQRSIWGAQMACVEESTACVGTTARILLERGALEMWLLRRLWGLNKKLRIFLGNLCFRRLCELSPTIRFDQASVVEQEEIRAFFRSVKDLEDGW